MRLVEGLRESLFGTGSPIGSPPTTKLTPVNNAFAFRSLDLPALFGKGDVSAVGI